MYLPSVVGIAMKKRVHGVHGALFVDVYSLHPCLSSLVTKCLSSEKKLCFIMHYDVRMGKGHLSNTWALKKNQKVNKYIFLFFVLPKPMYKSSSHHHQQLQQQPGSLDLLAYVYR